MKKIIFASYLTAVSFSVIASANNDYVDCKRNLSTVKQYCSIKDEKFGNLEEINMVKTVGATNINIQTEMISAKLNVIDTANGNSQLDLNSLKPKAYININWNDDPSCLVSSLWKDDIELLILDGKGRDTSVKYPIELGTNSFSFDLSSFISESFTPITYTAVNDKLIIETNYKFFNASYYDNRPTASARIPHDCSLKVSSVDLLYSPRDLASDLEFLRVQANSEIEIMSKATVQHASYLNASQAVGQCIVYNLAENLLSVELSAGRFVFGYEDLTSVSKNMITNSVQAALNHNMMQVDPNSTDLLDYVTDISFKDFGQRECDTGNESTVDYEVSTTPFIRIDVVDGISTEVTTNYAGRLNAESFEEARLNVINIAKSAFAISEVSKSQIDNYTSPEWLESGALLSEF